VAQQQRNSSARYLAFGLVINGHAREGSGYPPSDASNWPLGSNGKPTLAKYAEWIQNNLAYESADFFLKWRKGQYRPKQEQELELSDALGLPREPKTAAERHAIWELQASAGFPCNPNHYSYELDCARLCLLRKFPELKALAPHPHGTAKPTDPQAAEGALPGATESRVSVLPAYETHFNRLARLLKTEACAALREQLRDELSLPEEFGRAQKSKLLLEALLGVQAESRNGDAVMAILRLAPLIKVPAQAEARSDLERALTQAFVLCLMDWLVGKAVKSDQADGLVVRLRESHPLSAVILAEAVLGGELRFEVIDHHLKPQHYIPHDEVGVLPGAQAKEVLRGVAARLHVAHERQSLAAGTKPEDLPPPEDDLKGFIDIERRVRFRHWRLLVLGDGSAECEGIGLALSVGKSVDLPVVVVNDGSHTGDADNTSGLRPGVNKPDAYIRDFLHATKHFARAPGAP
jgi:hypothetical protein